MRRCNVEDLFQGRELRVVVCNDRVVFPRVVGDEERPASLVALVAIAAMQDVAVEEDGVACRK